MDDKKQAKGICDCCKQVRLGLYKVKLMKNYAMLCNECREEMKFVNICLKSGTDKIVKTMPESYRRTSNISVTPIIAIC